MEEAEATSETEYTEIRTNTEALDNSTVFHVIKNVLGFILYMHQQIPSVLQDTFLEFNKLKDEYEEMSVAKTEARGAIRRGQLSKMREIRVGIKRFEKLIGTIREIETALQAIICEIPRLESLILIIGANPLRPLQVYELCFDCGNSSVCCQTDFAKNKAAEALSKKAIRALIKRGVGSDSYPGPTKLFLLVKAPSSLNQPLHFLPKRDFRYSSKIVPVRLRVRCKSHNLQMDALDCTCPNSSSVSLTNSASNELIWFQCRHVVKGIAFVTPTEE